MFHFWGKSEVFRSTEVKFNDRVDGRGRSMSEDRKATFGHMINYTFYYSI